MHRLDRSSRRLPRTPRLDENRQRIGVPFRGRPGTRARQGWSQACGRSRGAGGVNCSGVASGRAPRESRSGRSKDARRRPHVTPFLFPTSILHMNRSIFYSKMSIYADRKQCLLIQNIEYPFLKVTDQ